MPQDITLRIRSIATPDLDALVALLEESGLTYALTSTAPSA